MEWFGRSDCYENDQPKQNTYIEFTLPNSVATMEDFTTTFVNSGKNWNSKAEKLCYIKIKVLAQKGEKVSFIVQSFEERNWDESFGFTVGTSIERKDSGHVLCLEYRRSSPEFTYVMVSPMTETCRSFDRNTGMASSLKNEQSNPKCSPQAAEKSKEEVVSFCVPGDSTGQNTYGTCVGREKKKSWMEGMLDVDKRTDAR